MARLTWQNVDAPDFGSSVQGLKNAFDSVDRGFDTATRTIDDYDKAKTVEQSNAIMAQVLQLGTPEAAAAALASGQLTNGVDPRRINAEAFKSMAGRQDDLLRTAASGIKLQEDQIGLGQTQVKDVDFKNANALRPVLNEMANAYRNGDEAEGQRLYGANKAALDALPPAMVSEIVRSGTQDYSTVLGSNVAGDQYQESKDVATIDNAAGEIIGDLRRRGETVYDLNINYNAYRDRLMKEHGGNAPLVNRILRKAYEGVNGGASVSGTGGAPGGGGAVGGSGTSVPTNAGSFERVVNYEAKGRTGVSQVPDSVQTLGDLVQWGKSINEIGSNPKGERSSATGLYQITWSTYDEFGSKALGADWKSKPLNAENQDKVAEAIYQDALSKPNPVAALRGRWSALKKLPDAEVQAMVNGGWSKSRARISSLESGVDPKVFGAGGAAAPQRDYRRAEVAIQFANKHGIAVNELTPIVTDFEKAWSDQADPTQVANDLIKGAFKGDDPDNLTRVLTDYMKKYKLPARLMGQVMTRARVGKQGALRNFADNFWGSDGIQSDFDEKKLDQFAKLAGDRAGMGDAVMNLSDTTRAMEASARGVSEFDRLTTEYNAEKANAALRGEGTAAIDRRYLPAIAAARAAMDGGQANAALTGSRGSGNDTNSVGNNKTPKPASAPRKLTPTDLQLNQKAADIIYNELAKRTENAGPAQIPGIYAQFKKDFGMTPSEAKARPARAMANYQARERAAREAALKRGAIGSQKRKDNFR